MSQLQGTERPGSRMGSHGVVEGNLLSGTVSVYKLAAQFLTCPAPKQEIIISPLAPSRAPLKEIKRRMYMDSPHITLYVQYSGTRMHVQ